MMNRAADQFSDSPNRDTTAGGGEPTKTAAGSHRTLAMVSPGGASREVEIPSSIGDVKIEMEIGRGGMGIVFRGTDAVLHRTVAVKFLPFLSANRDDPRFERFFGGARAEATVRHFNIVVVHAAGLVSGIPFLIMDYIDGLSLREVLRRSGPMSLAAAVKIMWDVADAMTALHHSDVIHQDLKPGNVLFDQDGRLFVTDFGLASLRRQSDAATSSAGTPSYMAPELFEGRASPQSDVYAMGIMLYELLAARLPFAGDFAAVREQHINAPLLVGDLPDSIPESIIDILQRCTNKNHLFRYKQAEHFRRALRNCVANDGFLRQGALELKQLVLAGKQGAPSSPPAHSSSEPPSSGSYFDRIAEIAEKKRASQAGMRNVEPNMEYVDPWPTTQDKKSLAPAAEQIPTFPADARLAVEVPCVKCDYNLFGLLAGSPCPECGTAVAASLRPDRLLFAPKSWLKRLSAGQLILDWALGIFPWLYIVFTLLVPVMNLEIIFGVIMGLSYLFIIALVVGIFVSTVKEPQTQGTTRESNLPQAARITSLLLIITLLARAIADIFSLHISNIILTLAVVAMIMGFALAYLFYSAGLADRIPNVRLGRVFRQAAILLVTVLVLSVALSAGLHQWIGKLIGVDPIPRVIVQTLAVGLFFGGLVSLVLSWLQIRKLRRTIKRLLTDGIAYDCLFESTVQMDANPSG